jgi:hypothetical protein
MNTLQLQEEYNSPFKNGDVTSESDTSSNEGKRVIEQFHQLYYEPKKNVSLYTDQEHIDTKESLSCKFCFEKSGKHDNYIVLSCNHVFHIQCLAESHFNDVYKFNVIDTEYFESRKCLVCTKKLEVEELMFLHTKFLSNTKEKLQSHQTKIVSIEERIRKLKEELRVCYDYRHKLDHDRGKSKQIVTTLMTEM